MSKSMHSREVPLIWGWALVGSAVACSAAVVAVAAASVKYLSALTAEKEREEPVELNTSSADSYTKVRISGVGRKMTLESVAPVPPENPHAPPAPGGSQ